MKKICNKYCVFMKLKGGLGCLGPLIAHIGLGRTVQKRGLANIQVHDMVSVFLFMNIVSRERRASDHFSRSNFRYDRPHLALFFWNAWVQ